MVANIREVKSGIEPAIIVINGFLSESTQDISDWMEIINQLYPDNRVLHFQWPACHVTKLLGLSGSSIDLFKNLALSRLTGGAFGIAGGALWSWFETMDNAIKAGKTLSEYIDQSQDNYILMGHSLGARVSFHALLNSQRNAAIRHVYLLGGAVSCDAPWKELFRKHSQLMITNCYSDQDYVLKTLYKAGTLFSNSPSGLKPINNNDLSFIYNVNLSDLVTGHMDYKNAKVGNRITSRTKLSNGKEEVVAAGVGLRRLIPFW